MQRRGKSCWVLVDERVELDAEEEMHRVTKRLGRSDQRMKQRWIESGRTGVSGMPK